MSPYDQAPPPSPIPWVPIVIGTGVLVGGVLLYQSMKKPAVTAPAKPATAAKPATLPPASQKVLDDMAAKGKAEQAALDATDDAARDAAKERQAAVLKRQAQDAADDQAAKAQREAEYQAQKQKIEGEYQGNLAAMEAKWFGEHALSSVTAGGVPAAFGMRDADRFRIRLHEALCDHPDYLGIGFCRVGGEVGLVVAASRPIPLPRRLGPMPVVVGYA